VDDSSGMGGGGTAAANAASLSAMIAPVLTRSPLDDADLEPAF
jgi:hypothetical protein